MYHRSILGRLTVRGNVRVILETRMRLLKGFNQTKLGIDLGSLLTNGRHIVLESTVHQPLTCSGGSLRLGSLSLLVA